VQSAHAPRHPSRPRSALNQHEAPASRVDGRANRHARPARPARNIVQHPTTHRRSAHHSPASPQTALNQRHLQIRAIRHPPHRSTNDRRRARHRVELTGRHQRSRDRSNDQSGNPATAEAAHHRPSTDTVTTTNPRLMTWARATSPHRPTPPREIRRGPRRATTHPNTTTHQSRTSSSIRRSSRPQYPIPARRARRTSSAVHQQNDRLAMPPTPRPDTASTKVGAGAAAHSLSSRRPNHQLRQGWAGRGDARASPRERPDRRPPALHLSASRVARLALLIDPALAAAFRVRVIGAAERMRCPTSSAALTSDPARPRA
jgi:hypothetical protein